MDARRPAGSSGGPLQPPGTYEEFAFRSSAFPYPGSSAPVEAPRITPPPSFGTGSLFASNEEESLASFLHDFEDSSEFLFQPTLPQGMPDYSSLFGGDDTNPFGAPDLSTSYPSEMRQLTPKATDTHPLPFASMPGDPPSAKRFRSEDGSSQASPSLIIPHVTMPVPLYGVDGGAAPPSRSSRNGLQASRSRNSTSHPTTPSPDNASNSSRTSVDVKPAPPKKALLTEAEKRNNHIQSEQKRRDAIRNGFSDLVILLRAGESESGLSIGADDEGKKPKGKGRGRGRKGDGSAGAAKSVVLTQACRYVSWLEQGNEALEAEVQRLESLTGMA